MIHFLIVLISSLVWSQQPNETELACEHVPLIQQRLMVTHLAPPNGDVLQKRTIEQYMKRLDGGKLYLTDAEYKSIEKSMQNIFNKITSKDCSPMIKANELLVKRIEERVKYVKEYLGPKFKIEKDLKIQTDAEKRKRPANEAAGKKAFEAQLQWDIANYVATEIGLEEAKKHVMKNYDRVLKHAQKIKSKDVLGNFLDCFASALDPHSNYMPSEAHEDFEIQMKLALEGIGASLMWKDGFTVVERLLPGGAAMSTGLVKPKDKIVAVAQGQDGAWVDVIEMELRDVIKLIRGPKGTSVRLKLIRRQKGEVKNIEVALNRAKITLEDQAAFIKYFDREVNGKKLKIAFLNLPSFYDDLSKDGKSATNDLRRLAGEAVTNKADALVLDLASNGGGSLQDAVDVSGLFMVRGEMLRVGRGGRFQGLADEDPKVYWPGPLVVLTNRVSASASEIVSGVLQDYKRAVIVGGDHTYGKGTVQSIEQLAPGLGAIKTTTAMFYTAGGFSTQHRGVPGDIVFPSVLAQDSISEKKLDYSLPPQRIAQFLAADAYAPTGEGHWTVLKPEVIKSLKTKSTKRIAESAEFKKLKKELAKPKPSSIITIASLLKGKDPNSTKAEEEEKESPSREERIKEYLKTPEVNEAVNIAADLAGVQ